MFGANNFKAALTALSGASGLAGGFTGLVISAVIAFLVYNVLKEIPAKHREMEPPLVWLLLIPCFNLVWNFFVYPGLAKSFKRYFDSVGDDTVGDCGLGLAKLFCVMVVLAVVIPFVGWFLLSIVALVLWIILIVKAYELKSKMAESGAGAEE